MSVQQPHQVDIFYINYFAGIDEEKVRFLMSVCNEIVVKVKPNKLYFLISSNGGSVDAGITLYNFLRSLPVEIIMHNMGSIDSIANVVFLAGNKRYACRHSAFLFHGIVFNLEKASLNRQQITELLSRCVADEKKIAGIYKDRTNLSETEVNDLSVQGESKDLLFAKSKNIIDDIISPNIPKDAQIITINFK